MNQLKLASLWPWECLSVGTAAMIDNYVSGSGKPLTSFSICIVWHTSVGWEGRRGTCKTCLDSQEYRIYAELHNNTDVGSMSLILLFMIMKNHSQCMIILLCSS